MKITQALKDIGLSDTEAEVYLALIKTSGAQPASIVANKTKMNRTTVYKTLLHLVKMGLVIKTVKSGILCFYSEDPEEQLKKLIKEKQERLNEASRQVTESLPFLISKHAHQNPPKIDYYEGLRGVIQVYEDTLMEQQTIYAIENVGSMDAEIKNFLLQNYVPRRIEKEIFAYVVAPQNKENKNLQKTDRISMRETRLLKKSSFAIDLEINIYGSKVAYFSYKTEEMFAIIIKSQTVANAMKAVFDVCWEAAK